MAACQGARSFRAHRWEPFISLQPTYSLVTRDIEREILPFCLREGLAVLPYGPLAGGLLTGKYPPGQQPTPDTRAGSGDEMTARGMSMRMSEQSFAIVDAVRAVGEQLGKTPAQVALKWVMSREGVTAPILGARTPEQLERNLGVLGWELDAELDAQLTKASEIPLGYPYNFQAWMAEIGR